MGVREEALGMLKEGLSPAQVAKRRGVSLKSILGYLNQMVGAGLLRRLDILLSVPSEVRRPALEERERLRAGSLGGRCGVEELKKAMALRGMTADADELAVVCAYADARHALGDAYDDLRAIETGLHALIRRALEEKYGAEEHGWWRQGVPGAVRRECASRREEDDTPADSPFAYSDLLDLRTILDKEWSVIALALRSPCRDNRKTLLSDLQRLNVIRRFVMHPVRGARPSEEDFEFLAKLKSDLGF
jgi:hypothetical protein